MKQTNNDLLRKFEQMKRWMIEDTRRAMFDAKANFLVAQGLFNYTEIIGSFIKPNGNSSERFDAFFERMGIEYKKLLKRHNGKGKGKAHQIYDDLRCGLTHEYAIKRKDFTVYNATTSLTDAQIDTLVIPINGIYVRGTCGVMHSWTPTRKGVWHILDPKYWLDFKNALDEYWAEINNPRNNDLKRDFFKRARKINFLKFG